MNLQKHWLHQWIEEYGVRSTDQARRLLSDADARGRLRELAIAAHEGLHAPLTGQVAVLAGSGMDFSSTRFDCPDFGCRKHQIDTLFSRIWHYFDCVVVDDPIGCWIARETESRRVGNERILSEISLQLYLHEIGADQLMIFRHKPRPTADKWRVHSEAESETMSGLDSKLVADFEAEATFRLSKGSSGELVFVSHPLLLSTSGSWSTPAPQEKGFKLDEQTRLLYARAELALNSAYLADDVAAARLYEAPLGLAVPLHERLLRARRRPSVAEVAFQLELPVLAGVSAATLVTIRTDEHEYFARFRDRLRLAIQEQLRETPSERAAVLAEQIKRDLIEPELNRIRLRLAASERALKRKSTVGMFLGALTTGCGLLAGLPAPLAVSAGTAATVAAVGTAANKYLDEQAEISLDDMYFAWRATQHAPPAS